MMLAQMRALRAERLARAQEHAHATEAERTRIAREIHDLVGHSLSITLLHLTAARRAVAEGDDPDEAVSALTEAEGVGRRAMAEIRRTIGVQSSSGAGTAPLPGAAGTWSGSSREGRSAGQTITFSSTGDLSRIDAGVGLGIYRILQESLANAIRHAPGHRSRSRWRSRTAYASPCRTRSSAPGAGSARDPGWPAWPPAPSSSAAGVAGAEESMWKVDLVIRRTVSYARPSHDAGQRLVADPRDRGR